MIEKSPSNTAIAIAKTVAIGFVMGLVGVIIGAFPIMVLRNQLFEIIKVHYGSYFVAVPGILRHVVLGFPLYIGLVWLLPVGGALFGIIGATTGLLRRSARLWLWGAVAGLLFNFLVSFHSQ